MTFDYKKLITACCFNLCSWHLVTRLLTLDVLYKIFIITYQISILNFIQRLEDPLPPIGYLMHLVGVDVLTLPPCRHWVWSSRFAYNNFTATDVIFNASSCVLPNVLNSQRALLTKYLRFNSTLFNNMYVCMCMYIHVFKHSTIQV